jgi:hypothetical protein
MTRRMTSKTDPASAESHAPPKPAGLSARVGISERLATHPHSLAEAEEIYVVMRDAWTAAMRQANSGRPADMASLAIAQEAYEAAAKERELWLTGKRVAIPVESEHDHGISAVVQQELAWRHVHRTEEPRPGPLRRLARRLTGR